LGSQGTYVFWLLQCRGLQKYGGKYHLVLLAEKSQIILFIVVSSSDAITPPKVGAGWHTGPHALVNKIKELL
tara:strand:- start:671 stop:886 length:216 start_codon:yes stop_codon:yes gene_type:complete